MPLKVLTLNIWNDSGPWPERSRRIRAWVEQLDPDVIGFQEVLRAPGWFQLDDVLDGLGYHLDYARASAFWRPPEREFGNAVASRWPVRDREELALPHLDSGETRCALSVTIDAPFGPLSFTTTHLNWKFHHGYVRERQVVELAKLVRRRRPRDGFPPVVVGDFNAEPDADEIRYLRGLHSIDGGSVAFHDAWQVAGDGGPGYTWANANPYARVEWEPDRRIDYIFTGFPRRDGTGGIITCRVVCNDEQNGVWLTDHFGLYAELATEPAAR